MADEILSRDQNHVTVLAGVTDDANEYITMLRVDPSTKRLLVSAIGLGTGDVVGPASATDNAIVRFDGATGKIIQNSSVTIDNDGSITIPQGQFIKSGANTIFGGNGFNTLFRPDSSGGEIQMQSFSGDNNTIFYDDGHVAFPSYISFIDGGYIADASGNELLVFDSTAAAVDYVIIRNTDGDGPVITSNSALNIHGATNSGGVYIEGGDSTDPDNEGGTVEILAGSATTGNAAGGVFNLGAGSGFGAGEGGGFFMQGGPGGATGEGGDFVIDGGLGGVTSGSGGSVVIRGGSAQGTNSNGGEIAFTPGVKTGSGVAGVIKLTDPTSSISAVLATTSLASTDKTFTFPNATGTFVLNDNTATLSNKTLTAPKFADLGYIADANGNEMLVFDTVASAVEYITIKNAAVEENCVISATDGLTIAPTTGLDITGTYFAVDVTGSSTFDAPDWAIRSSAGNTEMTASGLITMKTGLATHVGFLNFDNIATSNKTFTFPNQTGVISTVTSGAGAPGSTPAAVGQIYVDTTGDKIYVSTATASSADWTILN